MILLFVSTVLAADHHVVRKGETIATIAAAEDVDPAALRRENGLGEKDEPKAGTVLRLPGTETPLAAATALAVSGGATLTPAGGTAQALVPGAELPPGSVVCTPNGGYATLRLATATGTYAHDEITLLGGTCVSIDDAWADRAGHASLVSVRSGTVSVRADTPGSGQLTVRTDDAVSTGDAGGFRVSVEADATRTEAVSGAVSVLGGGDQVELQPGFGARTKEGQAPSAPVALLVAPALLHPDADVALRRPDFSWGKVDRALAYRVEIASDPDFVDIVDSEDVGALRWQPETLFLPIGRLWWRVTPVDRTGFVGTPSAARGLAMPGGLGK